MLTRHPVLRCALVALVVVVLLPGCRKKTKSAAAVPTFSEEDLWARANDELAREKWRKASTVLKLLLDQYPSSDRVREAHILYADTLYRRGSDANLIEAQAKYMSFVSFYPEDDRTAYAQFQVAMCNYERRGKPDRDLAVTRDAISEFEKVIQSHPGSSYVDEARAKVRALRDELAEHELLVARFYRRRGFEESVVQRLKFMLDKYPEFSDKDQAYYLLADTLVGLDSAVEGIYYLEKLLAEYPRSGYRKDAEKLLAHAKKRQGAS